MQPGGLEGLSSSEVVVRALATAAADDLYPAPGQLRDEGAEAIAIALAQAAAGDPDQKPLADLRADAIADDLLPRLQQ